MVLGKRDIGRAFSPKVVRTRPTDHAPRGVAASEQSHMKVYIRVRPPNKVESEGPHKNIVKILNQETVIFDPKEGEADFFFHGVKQNVREIGKRKNKEMEFLFDRVYSPTETNQDVFDGSTKDIITSLLDGYNCSVFVYGATGAGKTHTMLGNEDHKGIMYLTMVDLYRHMDLCKDKVKIELGISYLEVYNENVQDLLNPQKKQLHLREDSANGVVVAGIQLEVISNAAQLFELLQKGNNNRTQHPTDANAESSRSHAIFQVYVKMMDRSSQQIKMVKLSMIDLAGSERAAVNSSNIMRFKEGSNINKSLLALGNCINNLADGCRHIPFRDSKLTRILKDSLGGNCKTVMIANIGPTSASYEDTYNTLKYATRAKKIKAKLTKNIVTVEMHNAEYKKFFENVKVQNSALKEENDKLLKELEALKEQMNLQDFTNNRLNVDPQRKEMSSMYEQKKEILSELFRLSSQKLSIQWRINMKKTISSYLSIIEKEQFECAGNLEDVSCIKEDVKRIESSLSQFEGQIKSLDEKMACLSKQQVEMTKNINNWKQNLSSLVYEVLKPEMDKYTLEVDNVKWRVEAEHRKNLSNMLNYYIKSNNTILTEVSMKFLEYYSLLKVFNKTDHTMKEDHKNLIKRMKGIKNVKWLDDMNEEPEDFLNNYCNVDLHSFGNKNGKGLESPTSSDDVLNTTQTLSTEISPVSSSEVISVVPPKKVEQPVAATNSRPVANVTSTNKSTFSNTMKSKPVRLPLTASSQYTNRNRTEVRNAISSRSYNKENIPGSNILSKMSSTRNNPKYIPGAPRTPRENKFVNSNLKKTPAPAFDPSIGNRERGILKEITSGENNLNQYVEPLEATSLMSEQTTIPNALKSINQRLNLN